MMRSYAIAVLPDDARLGLAWDGKKQPSSEEYAHLVTKLEENTSTYLEKVTSDWGAENQSIENWGKAFRQGDGSARDKLLEYARTEGHPEHLRVSALIYATTLRTKEDMKVLCEFLKSPSKELRLRGFYQLPDEITRGVNYDCQKGASQQGFEEIIAELEKRVARYQGPVPTVPDERDMIEEWGRRTKELHDDAARDKLIAYVQDESRPEHLRATAIAAIAKVRSKENLRLLCACLRSPSARVRLAAFNHLPPEIIKGLPFNSDDSPATDAYSNFVDTVEKRISAYQVVNQ